MIKDAVASMDLGQKILLYESMKKNVGLITLISIFIPGGGQIYLGEYLKGLLILFLAWLVLPWLYGIYDAPVSYTHLRPRFLAYSSRSSISSLCIS